jgi:hypothetical protein
MPLLRRQQKMKISAGKYTLYSAKKRQILPWRNGFKW